MNKKKIAVFASGWASGILYSYLSGAKEGFQGYPADIYLFLNYSTYTDSDDYFRGEINIFQLPHLEDFDGALVFANTIDFPEIIGDINERCKRAEIPVVYTGNDKLGGFFVGSDNYPGARALCDHIIEQHGAKRIFFIAGSRENMDSHTRMKALRDAMEAKGLRLEEEDIFYSDWSPTGVTAFVKDRIDKGDMPDAVVCANDILAMNLCNELSEYGYPVPEKIIVTGFDNDSYAKIYDPVISSVDQRFDLLGRRSAETLIKVFQGEKVEKYQTIPCEFIPGESCGCMSARDCSRIRKLLGRNKFTEDTKNTIFDQNLFVMERAVMAGKGYEELKESLRTVYTSQFRDYHGDSFHVVLDPLFEQSIYNQERQLRQKGYPPTMDAVFSVRNGEFVSIPEFDSGKLVPMPYQDEDNHQYIFLPLHEEAGNMGYVVFCDDLLKVKEDMLLRKYKERMSIILGFHRRDLQLGVLHNRLLEMTETDALTHVKNRTAYRAREEKLQDKIQAGEDIVFAVAVFDVNNLKQINDKFGHEAGDDYIIDACRMICKAFKKSAVYRIGGDEFAVVLEREDFQAREELMRELGEAMEELNRDDIPVYKRVSFAFGMADFDRNLDADYAGVFKRADAKMYENKAIMKKRLRG